LLNNPGSAHFFRPSVNNYYLLSKEKLEKTFPPNRPFGGNQAGKDNELSTSSKHH
jgi:hypothetical protein